MTRRVTRLPPSRPVLPALRRMLLGLGLGVAGAVLVWQDARLVPRPGLNRVSTDFRVPLDGPLPLDVARDAVIRVSGDRADIHVWPLAPKDPDLLRGQGTHRERNPLRVQSGRTGGNVRVALTMNVRGLDEDLGIGVGPEPYQHTIDLNVTPRIPLTLNVTTSGGAQTLDLSSLRLRSLTARSTNVGTLNVTLPARSSGPLVLVSILGDIRVTGSSASAPEALRVTTRTGNMTLNLRSVQVETLDVNTTTGDVRLTLPDALARGTVQSASGNLTVTATPATSGMLDLRTVTGKVKLRVPADLHVRVRFPERETLTLPAGRDETTRPQLDVFADTSERNFEIERLSSAPLSSPAPITSPAPARTRPAPAPTAPAP